MTNRIEAIQEAIAEALNDEWDVDVIRRAVEDAITEYSHTGEGNEDWACSEEAIERRNHEWAIMQETPEEAEREAYALEEFERQLAAAPDADMKHTLLYIYESEGVVHLVSESDGAATEIATVKLPEGEQRSIAYGLNPADGYYLVLEDPDEAEAPIPDGSYGDGKDFDDSTPESSGYNGVYDPNNIDDIPF